MDMIWLMAEKAFGEQKFIAKSLLVPLTAHRAMLEPETPALNWTGLPNCLLKPAVPVMLPPPMGTLTVAEPLTPWRLRPPLKERVGLGAAGREAGGREEPARDIAVWG